jgi:hypothetical protein
MILGILWTSFRGLSTTMLTDSVATTMHRQIALNSSRCDKSDLVARPVLLVAYKRPIQKSGSLGTKTGIIVNVRYCACSLSHRHVYMTSK